MYENEIMPGSPEKRRVPGEPAASAPLEDGGHRVRVIHGWQNQFLVTARAVLDLPFGQNGRGVLAGP